MEKTFPAANFDPDPETLRADLLREANDMSLV
jgi:hypothetical protein